MAVVFSVACNKSKAPDAAEPTSGAIKPTRTEEPRRGAYVVKSQPFSPTLPHLFDQGRILAIPADAAALPDAPIPVSEYAFTAVDRYGRVYHFDKQLRWGMAEGDSFEKFLPDGQWDVAWNQRAAAMELLVTDAFAGRQAFQLFRWINGRWTGIATTAANSPSTATLPAARHGARRLYLPDTQSWLVAGGTAVQVAAEAADADTTHAGAAEGTTITAQGDTTQSTQTLSSGLPSQSGVSATTTTSISTLLAPTPRMVGADSTTSATVSDWASWRLEGERWAPWGQRLATGEPIPADQFGLGKGASYPDLAHAKVLLGVAAEGGFAALLDSGDLWLCLKGNWSWRAKVPMENLFIARYLPDLNQILLVWKRGRGRDQVQLLDFAVNPEKADSPPVALNQTAQVKLNEEDEGLWLDWGRVREQNPAAGTAGEIFEPRFDVPGEDAIKLEAEYGEVIFRRSQIEMLELSPELNGLRPDAAAWVPAVGGLVVPSIDGVGLHASREPFFPVDPPVAQVIPHSATPGSAEPPTHQIDVIRRSFRIWIFKGDIIDWIKPASDIHPEIDYPDSFVTADGRRRTLSWTFPEPGLFRFEYHDYHARNEQWSRSPLLTLRNLPQLGWTPDSDLIICDPVLLGDPAQVIVIGWCGVLSEARKIRSEDEEFSGEAHATVPTRGFMARIDALNPRDWQVSPLPVPFVQGARIVTDAANGRLYLVGGKIAVPQEIDGEQLFLMVSHFLVWEWNGEAWNRIEPGGVQPRMKVTSNVAFDPAAGLLLSLTPRALYGFGSGEWQDLWSRDKIVDEEWPDEMGLYVHPLSHLTLGAWFKNRPELFAWHDSHWLPVVAPDEAGALRQPRWRTGPDARAGGQYPTRSQNLLPALRPDAFISIDGKALADLRMDVPRDRDNDRRLRAHWLDFTLEPDVDVRVPPPGLLGLNGGSN